MSRSPSPEPNREATQASLLDEFHSRCILCGCPYAGPHTKIFDLDPIGQYYRAAASRAAFNFDRDYPWYTGQNGLLLCPQCAFIKPDGCHVPATLVPCTQLLKYVIAYLQQPDKDFQVTSVDEILAELEANPEKLDPERKTVPFLHCYELIVFRSEGIPATIPIHRRPAILMAGSPPRRYQVFDPTESCDSDAALDGKLYLGLDDEPSNRDTVLWRIRRPPGAFLTFALEMCRRGPPEELGELGILVHNVWQMCGPTITAFKRWGMPVRVPQLYDGPPGRAVVAVLRNS